MEPDTCTYVGEFKPKPQQCGKPCAQEFGVAVGGQRIVVHLCEEHRLLMRGHHPDAGG